MKKRLLSVLAVLLLILTCLFIYFLGFNNGKQQTNEAKQQVAMLTTVSSSTSEITQTTHLTTSVTETSQNVTTEITVEKLATKHLLNVKSQLQKEWNYCAPTTVSMMLSARGISVDQYQLAKEMGTYEPFGTHNRDAIAILNQHLFGYQTPKDNEPGYRLETVTGQGEQLKKFKERLRQNIQDGYPMYYTFDVSKVYPPLTGEHNVIGIGYETSEDGQDVTLLYYLDPSPNVYDQETKGLKTITPEALFDAMLTCQEPNYAW